jgi:hypothetical protein
MAQFGKLETTQKLFISVSIDVLFVLLNPNTLVSYQLKPFLVLSYTLSLTPLIYSLCLSLPLFRLLPTLFLPATISYKRMLIFHYH